MKLHISKAAAVDTADEIPHPSAKGGVDNPGELAEENLHPLMDDIDKSVSLLLRTVPENQGKVLVGILQDLVDQVGVGGSPRVGKLTGERWGKS